MDQIFVRLANNYGTLFTGRFASVELAEAAKREWAVDLSRYTLMQIESALELCKTQYPDYPPTLGQFRKLCEQRTHAAHAEYKALPAPRNKPAALAALTKMRGLLKINPITTGDTP
jgi:hypothetical protein